MRRRSWIDHGQNEAGFLNPASNLSQFLPLYRQRCRKGGQERYKMNQYIGELSDPKPLVLDLKQEAKQPLLLLTPDLNINSEIEVVALPERKEIDGIFARIKARILNYQN